MVARFRSWRQQIITHPVTTVLISLFVTLVVLVILGGYKLNWNWTGFNGNNKSGKTLWDWMQLLFIPAVLAVAGFWFNHRERKATELRAENEQKAAELRTEAEREIEQQRAKAEQEISLDNQREAALQAYINEMSELLLHENLRESKPEDEVRKIARVRTLTVLPRLDPNRKGNVLLFLAESGLIGDAPTIDLNRADLSGVQLYKPWLNEVNLQETDLSEANLSKADLYEAHLVGSILHDVNLREADLRRADLHRAELEGANLSEADLSEADLQRTNLDYADLRGATMRAANLSEAHLRKANLQGAILLGANLHRAKLADADLSEATLYNSANILPEQLEQAKSLKGATTPDGSIHA